MLPYPIEKDHGKDIRDWLVEGNSYADLLALGEAAAEWTPTAETKPADDAAEVGEFSFVKVIADLICENNHFARDVGGKLYRYRDGAYRSKAEAYIRAEVKLLHRVGSNRELVDSIC